MSYPVSIVLKISWLENLLKWNSKIYKMTLLGHEKTLYLHRKKENCERRNFYNRQKKMVKLPAAQKLCQQHSCQNRQFEMKYPVSIVLKKILAGKSFKMEFKNLQIDTFRA